MPPSETNAGASGAQAATGAQPQEGASQAQAAEAQRSQADRAESGSSTVDVAQVQRELTEARREAAKNRTELQTLRDAQRQAGEAKLSDAERITKRVAELETTNTTLAAQLQAERVRSSVISAATRLGFADPGDAYSLLDHSDITIEDGHPKGVDKALKDLLARKPYLASSTARASGSAEGGVRGGSAVGADMNTLIRQAAGRH